MKRIIFAVASAAALTASAGLCEDLSVPIRVVERAGAERKAEPVTVGVPVPRGVLKDTGQLRLSGPDGKDVPAQFDVATYWWHTAEGMKGEKSVKRLHVDFQADAPAGGEAVYTLKTGGAGTAKDSPLETVLSDGRATVSTGPLKFTVRSEGFNVLDEVWIDGNQVVKSHGDGILLLSNVEGGEKNTVYSSAKSPAETGLLSASDSKFAVGAGIHWFWETWPKAVEADGSGKITVHLWPNVKRKALQIPAEWEKERCLQSRLVPGGANVCLGMSHTYRFLSRGSGLDF